jgi:hypothetical protein
MKIPVTVRLVGGPRDGDTIELEAHLVGVKSAYLTSHNAPGVYWRAAGLGPLVLEFLPAPGGQFTEAPVMLVKHTTELVLCP